jgi:hypothetical protein
MSTPRRQVIESNIENSLQREQEAQQAPAFQSGTGTGPILNNFTSQALGQVQGYLTQGAQNIVSHKQEEQFISGAMDYLQGKSVEELQENSGRNLHRNKGYMVLDVNNKFTSFLNEFKNKIGTDYYSQSPEEFKETSSTLFGEQLKGLDPLTGNMFKEKLLPMLPQLTEMHMVAHDNFNTGETIKAVKETIGTINKNSSEDDVLQTMLDIKATTSSLNPEQLNASITNGILESLVQNDNLYSYQAFRDSMYWKDLPLDQKNSLSSAYSKTVGKIISKFDLETEEKFNAIIKEYNSINGSMNDTAFRDAMLGVFKEQGIRKEDILSSYFDTKITEKKANVEKLNIVNLRNAMIKDTNYDTQRLAETLSIHLNQENKTLNIEGIGEVLNGKTPYNIGLADEDSKGVDDVSIAIASTKFSAEEVNAWSEKGGPDGEIQKYISTYYDRKLKKPITQYNEEIERVMASTADQIKDLGNLEYGNFTKTVNELTFKYGNGMITEKTLEEGLKKAIAAPNLPVTQAMFALGPNIKSNRRDKLYQDQVREKVTRLNNDLAGINTEYNETLTKLFKDTIPEVEDIDEVKQTYQAKVLNAIQDSNLDPAIVNKAVPLVQLENAISAAQKERAYQEVILKTSRQYQKTNGDFPKDKDGLYLNASILDKGFNEQLNSNVTNRVAEESTRPIPLAPASEGISPLDVADTIIDTKYIPNKYKSLGISDIIFNASDTELDVSAAARIQSESILYSALKKEGYPYLAQQLGTAKDRALLETLENNRELSGSFEGALRETIASGSQLNPVVYKEVITELDEFIENEYKLSDLIISGDNTDYITSTLHMIAAETLIKDSGGKKSQSMKTIKKRLSNFMRDNVVTVKDSGVTSTLIHKNPDESFMGYMFQGAYADVIKPKAVPDIVRKFLIDKESTLDKEKKDVTTTLTTKVKVVDSLFKTVGIGEAKGNIFSRNMGVNITYNSKVGTAVVRMQPAYASKAEQSAYIANGGKVTLDVIDLQEVGKWYTKTYKDELLAKVKRKQKRQRGTVDAMSYTVFGML